MDGAEGVSQQPDSTCLGMNKLLWIIYSPSAPTRESSMLCTAACTVISIHPYLQVHGVYKQRMSVKHQHFTGTWAPLVLCWPKLWRSYKRAAKLIFALLRNSATRSLQLGSTLANPINATCEKSSDYKSIIPLEKSHSLLGWSFQRHLAIFILGLTPVDIILSLENRNSQKCLAELRLLSLLSGHPTLSAGKAYNVPLCSWLPLLTSWFPK